MNTRSKNISIIPRIYTKSVVSLQFAKPVDSEKAIINLISDAEAILNFPNSRVIISLVIPDAYYKNSKNPGCKKIHQAHTFALTRDSKYLMLYYVNGDLSFKSRRKFWSNYKHIINSLKKNRKLIFFPLKYGIKLKLKSVVSNSKEGLCFEYIKDLETRNIILTPTKAKKILKYKFKINI